jgi:O-antigen ligase
MAAALVCGVVLSGTRTTQVAAVAAAAVTGVFYFVRRQPLRLRVAITLLAGALITAIAVFFIASPVEINPYTITALTTGRIALWIAGLQKFLAQPLTGWGVGTWQVGLASYMPEYTEYGADAFVESLKAGAFHNAYLTALAERGLVAFLPGCALLGLAVREAFLIRRLGEGSETDRLFALAAPFGLMALIFRGLGEQGGLFGNADALVDFAVMGLCAQVIATAVAARRDLGRRRIGSQDSIQQV